MFNSFCLAVLYEKILYVWPVATDDFLCAKIMWVISTCHLAYQTEFFHPSHFKVIKNGLICLPRCGFKGPTFNG